MQAVNSAWNVFIGWHNFRKLGLKMNSDIPTNIRVLRDEKNIEIHWPSGEIQHVAFFTARVNCRCASCVDELTGIRRLDPDTVSQDVHPVGVKFTGNYALKIAWSDGHDTGLYTWDALRALE